MRNIKFSIMGKDWRLRVLKTTKYKHRNGADSFAITHIYKRRIDVGPQGLNRETIIHELVHAYMAETYTATAALDGEAVEEILAEMFSHRGQELLDLADNLLQQIKAWGVDANT